MRDIQTLGDLLRRTSTGDRRAFHALYEATSAKLFGTILRILKDRDLSRDILQETYVKIWQNAGRFDAAKASPITWMAAIARNRALDEVRRHRPDSSAATSADDDLAELADTFAEPLAGRERGEDLARLMTCLDGLDADRRAAVLLAYYRGHSRETLAERFGRPVSTIKTWLHRSLAQLRECLAE